MLGLATKGDVNELRALCQYIATRLTDHELRYEHNWTDYHWYKPLPVRKSDLAALNDIIQAQGRVIADLSEKLAILTDRIAAMEPRARFPEDV